MIQIAVFVIIQLELLEEISQLTAETSGLEARKAELDAAEEKLTEAQADLSKIQNELSQTLTAYDRLEAEVAELASMSMELLSMKYWKVFYENEEELKRAKKEQLNRALNILPSVAKGDKFQHWVYTTPHTANERRGKWIELNKEFGNQIIDWKGYEDHLSNSWQSTLHFYEVPFYYIEYGMAQLGAIAMWREYILKGEEALDNYMEALKLGYTKSISEIYETAGIEFNFSVSYVKELANFIKEELSKIN